MTMSNAIKIDFDAAEHDLSKHAMLVQLSFSIWNVSRTTKAVSNEYAKNHAVDPKMLSARKKILEDNDQYSAITAAATAIRKAHYKRTLPWGKGLDIISMSGFSDYTTEISDLVDKFNLAVDDFVKAYPHLVTSAELKLNSTLFDAKQYPSAAQIKEKFSVRIDPMPFATANDFRLEINRFELNKIKTSYEQSYNAKLGNAISDIFQKLAEPIQTMSEKLRAFKEISDDKGKRHRINGFHETLVTNIKTQLDILPSLNILNDPKIDQFIADVRRELCKYDAESLKSDEVIRIATADKADEILDRISAYL